MFHSVSSLHFLSNKININLDINECEILNGGCEHQCKNAYGSYICGCNKGFFLNGNGKTCSGNSKINIDKDIGQ